MIPTAQVESRGPILESAASDYELMENIAGSIARAKIRDLSIPSPQHQTPLSGEVAYERQRLANSKSSVYGLLYDAHEFSRLCMGLIPESESGLKHVHVVITNQLIGTWDSADRRYHARTILCGSPSLISISGLVEAPAKAPGYYLARRSAEALGIDEEAKVELAESFADDCLSFDDPRVTEAAKGYVLQAISHRLTGEAFCSEPGCRLFNAHWQRELIAAQLNGGHEFCREHEILFRRQQKEGKA